MYNNNDSEQYYGGGAGCFAKGTLVLMADGTCKEIQELRTGDLVATG